MDLQLFAEEEKTEKATPRRREEARKKGQVFHSAELSAAAGLLTASTAVRWLVPWWSGQMLGLTKNVYGLAPSAVTDSSHFHYVGLLAISRLLSLLAPLFLAVMAAGILSNLAQVGFLFTAEPLSMQLNRLNPIAGLQRIFSRRSLANLAKILAKLALVGYVAWQTLQKNHRLIIGLSLVSVRQFGPILADLSWQLLYRCGAAVLVLAIADFAYQRWEYEKNLSMSVQEIKEEYKQTEGSPEVRAQIREKQRAMARARMMSAVPQADVVITNPTHYAIALKYDAESMSAPELIAKGAGPIAQRIIDIARQNGIMVTENRVLARSMYGSVEIGESIPAEFYQAAAEILAFVYESRGIL